MKLQNDHSALYIRYEYSLFSLIEEVHMIVTGAKDCLIYPIFLSMVRELHNRLENWKYSNSKYDDVVHSLLFATLEECKGYLNVNA